MKYYDKTVIPIIESHYENMSSLEKTVADFFIKNKTKMDFSSKNIAEYLFVSEATLSRFAKRCGFKGYREFIYRYKESFNGTDGVITDQARTVFEAYQEILNKSYNLAKEEQFRRIVSYMVDGSRVFVYGKGSSGLAAREMQNRFMRLGLDITALEDSDLMRMNASLLTKSNIAIGISISGETESVLDSLKRAHINGARTILITAYNRGGYHSFCDEVVLIAARQNLNYGNIISPQFPILLILDILYKYYLENDQKLKEARHGNTLAALRHQSNTITGTAGKVQSKK